MKSYKGFSLIELMIAMVIGMFLLASAFGYFLTNIRSSRNLMLYSRVQQELRMAGDLMQHDLRRAGFSLANPANVKTIYLKRQRSGTNASSYDCVLYSYYNASDNTQNSYGFMLDANGVIQYKTATGTAGVNTTGDRTCNVGGTYGVWTPLTSGSSSSTATDGVVKITGFDINVVPPWTSGPIQMSVTASNNTLTRPTSGSGSNSFLADGFAVGDLVFLSGFSNSSNNFIQAQISAVTATTMVLASTNSNGTPTALVDESSGSDRVVSRQGSALSITIKGQSVKDGTIKATYTQTVKTFNAQSFDSAN